MEDLLRQPVIKIHNYEDTQAAILFSFHETENVLNETAAHTIYFGLVFLAFTIALKYFRFHNCAHYLNPQQFQALTAPKPDDDKPSKAFYPFLHTEDGSDIIFAQLKQRADT